MASERRIGAESAQNRIALLDAAEMVMREEGYGAVTSRRVAAKAGLKPQLVHYYFRTMDDLFVALLRRVMDDYLARQTAVIGSSNPVRKLIELSQDHERVVLTTEFLALANHRKSIKDEMVRFSKVFRGTQTRLIEIMFEQRGISGALVPEPIVLVSFIEAITRIMVMETHLGIEHGRAEANSYIETAMRFFDGTDAA